MLVVQMVGEDGYDNICWLNWNLISYIFSLFCFQELDFYFIIRVLGVFKWGLIFFVIVFYFVVFNFGLVFLEQGFLLGVRDGFMDGFGRDQEFLETQVNYGVYIFFWRQFIIFIRFLKCFWIQKKLSSFFYSTFVQISRNFSLGFLEVFRIIFL